MIYNPKHSAQYKSALLSIPIPHTLALSLFIINTRSGIYFFGVLTKSQIRSLDEGKRSMDKLLS